MISLYPQALRFWRVAPLFVYELHVDTIHFVHIANWGQVVWRWILIWSGCISQYLVQQSACGRFVTVGTSVFFPCLYAFRQFSSYLASAYDFSLSTGVAFLASGPAFCIWIACWYHWLCPYCKLRTSCLAVNFDLKRLYISLFSSTIRLQPVCDGGYSCIFFMSLRFPTILVLSGFSIWFFSIHRRCVSGEWPRFLYMNCMLIPLTLSILQIEDKLSGGEFWFEAVVYLNI